MVKTIVAEKPREAKQSNTPKVTKENHTSEAVKPSPTEPVEPTVPIEAGKEAHPNPVIPEPSPSELSNTDEKETIVHIPHTKLFPFKNHPFQLRDDADMKALVASVKERGINQPVIVRPREEGGYEIISGHRRTLAAQFSAQSDIPCVVRQMSDDEAVLAMTESNLNQRSEILASERAKALKMQYDAIKHQGSKDTVAGVRSDEIVAMRNKMSSKNVQRYIALNNLIPELLQYADDKKMKFTVAVDLSYIKPTNQSHIALAIDAQQSSPSGSQATRMRELDQQNILNADIIDGIMSEKQKEEIKVIFNSQELSPYFEKDKSPREIKGQILKLLDEWKEKQPPEHTKSVKSPEHEK